MGQLASVTGTWMMIVVQDRLVPDLTAGSGTALTALTAVRFTPMLLLTLYGGRLADRHDKRTPLTVADVDSGVLVTLLAVLVLTDAARLWQLYAFGFAVGLTKAIEVPTLMAFVSELADPNSRRTPRP